MTGKNPFELRAEVLQMAKDMMDRQYEVSMQFAQQAYEHAVKANEAAASTWDKFVPQMYTVEDLMKKANEMYGFVAPEKTSGKQTLNEGSKK